MEGLDVELNDTENVKLQCQRDWRRLKDVQADLQSLPAVPLDIETRTGGGLADPDGAASGGDDIHDSEANSAHTHIHLQILHEREKRLKAELQALRERELRTLPEDRSLQMLILQRHQVKKLGQLTDTLTFLRAKRSEVLEELKAEEGASSSLQSLNNALKKKLAVAEQSQASDEEGSALVSVLTDLKAKVSKVNEVDRCFKNTLKEILSKHFSVPQGRAGAENVLDESRDVDMDNLLPLKTIVGRLIEQSLNSPQNPYIEIDERFWPPHIEFLLRCQIVLKDPQNSRRLKLVPFHL